MEAIAKSCGARLAAIAVIALGSAACEGFTPFDPVSTAPPLGRGPGNPTATDTPDAAGDAPAEGVAIGQLCLVTDLRRPLDCASNADFSGVTVEDIGTTQTTVASASGSFALTLGDDEFPVLRVGAGHEMYATTLMRIYRVNATFVKLPIIRQAYASAISGNTNVPSLAGRGAAVVLFTQEDGATTPPRSQVILGVPGEATALYETSRATEWTTEAGQTGDSGVALGFNIAPGLVTIGATYSDRTMVLQQVPIEAGTWTFLTGLFGA